MLRRTWWFATTLALAGGLVFGCGPATVQRTPADSELAGRTYQGTYPISVVCTIGPVTDMLRILGGGHLDVAGLMGPGVDPHLYTFVPSDVERLARSDIIFYNGLHLEGRMATLFEQLAARKPTIAVTQRLSDSRDPRLRRPPEFEGYFDPHVWHDPNLWAECVKYVAEVLGRFDPTHRDDYLRNRDQYLAQLEEADRYARDQLAAVPAAQRVLVTTHDAFGYFCLAYGLTSMPLKGVSTEDEVTIGRMEEVVDYLVEQRINAVFLETATPPQLVRALVERCRRAGHELRLGGELYADALGPPESGADTYLGMFRTNVDTIVSALK